MLEIKNLTKNYSSKKIGPFNININEDSTCSIIGRSRSGKTTLVNMLTNSINNYEGTVKFNGEIISKKDFTYINQIGTLFNHLTVIENLRLTSLASVEEILLVLEQLNLDKSYINKYPFELSGGEKQRIDLTRAIIQKNKIIILDEALSALDLRTKDEIYEILKELRSKYKLLIILITHDIEEALTLGDNIIVLEQGEIKYERSSTKILEVEDIDFLISKERLNKLRSLYGNN